MLRIYKIFETGGFTPAGPDAKGGAAPGPTRAAPHKEKISRNAPHNSILYRSAQYRMTQSIIVTHGECKDFRRMLRY